MKKCNKCEEFQSVENFYKHPTSRDGLQTICKKCLFNNGRLKTIKNRKSNVCLTFLNENEVFKPISFNENYLISNHGRIYVLEHFATRHIGSKFLKPTKMRNGYQTVQINNAKHYIHRLVAKAFLSDTSKKMVNHIDSDRTNNNVENLEWVSCYENVQHGVKKGNYSKKLKIENVENILRDNENTTKYLSDLFGVTETNINLIKNRKIWKHVTIH